MTPRLPLARIGRRAWSDARSLRVVVMALATLAAGKALARPIGVPGDCPPPEPAPTAAIAQRGAVSLEQAIQLASQRYPGRVVRADTVSRDGRLVHEIRILAEGEGESRMRIVRIDAESGRFL